MSSEKGIIAVSAKVADLANYAFLSVSGTLTITGFFVDELGAKVGNSFTSAAATTTAAKRFADLYGTGALPRGAEGFIGTFSANAYFTCGKTDQDLQDLQSNPTRYPIIAASSLVVLGRVG